MLVPSGIARVRASSLSLSTRPLTSVGVPLVFASSMKSARPSDSTSLTLMLVNGSPAKAAGLSTRHIAATAETMDTAGRSGGRCT